MFLRDSNDSPHLIHIWTAAAELLLSKSFIQASAHAAIVLRGRRNVFSATVRLPREPRNIAAPTMATVSGPTDSPIARTGGHPILRRTDRLCRRIAHFCPGAMGEDINLADPGRMRRFPLQC